MIARLALTLLVTMLLRFPWSDRTDTITILYTNDIHDHVRPGYDGVGGLPYISGYIKSILAHRKDVLVLDAGDVMEKGDMVAFETHSAITYETMAEIGYRAITLGNHDLDNGVPYLRSLDSHMPGMAFLCLNLIPKDGPRPFRSSKVFDVDGVKVGVIGLCPAKGGEYLDLPASAAALEEEARRLEKDSHIQIALSHIGSADCAPISALAPAIEIFVSGHTHEVIPKPIRIDKTGALIAQAGSYAREVGELDLTVSLQTRQIVRSDGRLVQMRQDSVPVDRAMPEKVRKRETELCPQAARVVAKAEKPLGFVEAAILAADAIRQEAGANIGFCHTGQIIRSGLPQGDIDINALFLTGGQRGHDLVTTKLTGKEIETYLKGLMEDQRGRSEWAGFRGALTESRTAKSWTIRTDLEATRLYRVVLPELEWEVRFKRVFANRFKQMTADEAARLVARCKFTFTDAMAKYVDALTQKGITLEAQVRKLAGE